MYFMLVCQSPFDMEPALLSYQPDELEAGESRAWKSCKRFVTVPPNPIRVTIDEGESGVLLELYDATIALMSRRLASELISAGVTNLDFYEVVVDDLEAKRRYETHVAFNVVGSVTTADLTRWTAVAHDAPDFHPRATFLRLAESVNGLVVHETIRDAIEQAGIDTLTFIQPGEWIG